MTGDAAAEAAQWHAWQHERTRRVVEAETVREAIRDAREEEERAARIETRHDPDFETFRARATGEPARTIASVLADLAAIRDKPWDPEAEPGSALNPVRLDMPQPAAQRSQRPGNVQRTLNRARAAGNDPFMQRMLAEYHEREAARESAIHRAEIASLEERLGYRGEISR